MDKIVKILCFVSIIFGSIFLISSTSFAQPIRCEGNGNNEDEAVHDALRNAVEQTIGLYLNSEMVVKNSYLEMDNIYANARGYVNSFSIISSNSDESGYHVTLQAEVDSSPKSDLLKKLNAVMLLHNPRIAVNIKNGDSCNSDISNSLMAMGFTHIAADENRIRTDLSDGREADYVINGVLNIDVIKVTLPTFTVAGKNNNEDINGGMRDTGLCKAIANLDIEIIKTSTNEIISHDSFTANKIYNNEIEAKNQVVRDISRQASEKINKAFSGHASLVDISSSINMANNKNENIINEENTNNERMIFNEEKVQEDYEVAEHDSIQSDNNDGNDVG